MTWSLLVHKRKVKTKFSSSKKDRNLAMKALESVSLL